MSKTITLSYDEYLKKEEAMKKLKDKVDNLENNIDKIDCCCYYSGHYFPHYSFRGKDEVIKELTYDIRKSNKQLESLLKMSTKEFKEWKKETAEYIK